MSITTKHENVKDADKVQFSREFPSVSQEREENVAGRQGGLSATS